MKKDWDWEMDIGTWDLGFVYNFGMSNISNGIKGCVHGGGGGGGRGRGIP